jgi:hypothetical protein
VAAAQDLELPLLQGLQQVRTEKVHTSTRFLHSFSSASVGLLAAVSVVAAVKSLV